ncbi:MAG: CapA family protein [Clostridia bacterium]|nr:CapA family protein [Clostridia bacterium]
MSNKPVKGIRIGNYRITPLGLAVLAVLLVALLAVIVLTVFHPFGNQDVATPNVTQTASPTEEVEATPTPAPTPEPTATPEPEPRSATIRSLGEIAIQQNLLRAAVNENTFNFDDMFSEISEVIGSADYTVADVEGTLGGSTEYSGSTRMITPPSLIGTLKNCGVDMLMLANDHALDGGFAELQATLQNCASEGMDYVGAAASAEERATPVIKDINGINVAFLAYTESLNGNEKNTDAAAIEYGVNLISKSNAKKDIENARAAGADVIICYCSWGEMLNPNPTDTEKLIAQKLVEWGVDVIIGYNPHVVQPATWLESKDGEGNVHRTLLLGATGNMLSDQYGQYDNGIIFQFTIQETEYGHFAITEPTYIPTFVWRSETEDGKYDYRSLAVGQWLDTAPEGMAYADAARMRQVWADLQAVMGTEVAALSAE